MKALLFLFPVLLLTHVSCVKPQACMDASKTELTVSEVAEFRSCSKNVNWVEWDFGDGTGKLMGNSVSHGWLNAGTYSVKIIAHFYEDRKKPDTKTITVNVH